MEVTVVTFTINKEYSCDIIMMSLLLLLLLFFIIIFSLEPTHNRELMMINDDSWGLKWSTYFRMRTCVNSMYVMEEIGVTDEIGG